jgi:hypothetical protein
MVRQKHKPQNRTLHNIKKKDKGPTAKNGNYFSPVCDLLVIPLLPPTDTRHIQTQVRKTTLIFLKIILSMTAENDPPSTRLNAMPPDARAAQLDTFTRGECYDDVGTYRGGTGALYNVSDFRNTVTAALS